MNKTVKQEISLNFNIEFDIDSVKTYSSSGEARVFNYDSYSGLISVDDIILSTQSLEKFRHKGAVFDVSGSTFSISIKESKQSLKFYIDNERSIEHGVNGLLGFTMAEAYNVRLTGSQIFHWVY